LQILEEIKSIKDLPKKEKSIKEIEDQNKKLLILYT
jgi:hypothetical protein